MADRIRFVNTASTSGGDGTTSGTAGGTRAYPGLREALTAEYALVPDLVSADVRLVIICLGTVDSSAGDYTFPAFTQDATRHVYIKADASARHAGILDYGKYTFRNTYNRAFYEVPSQVVFEGIQIEVDSSLLAGGFGIVVNTVPTGFTITLIDCLLNRKGRDAGVIADGSAIQVGGVTAKSVRLINTLILGSWYQALGNDYQTGGTTVLYNNTVVGAENGFNVNTGASPAMRAFNNRVQLRAGSGGPCYSFGSGALTSGGNLSSDATSPQAGLRNVTGTFVNAGAGNYTPDTGDAGIGVGTDLSADGTYPFSTDAAGATRSAPWDAGALRYGDVPVASLVIDTQPSATQSGFLMDPVVVNMTTDGEGVDTSFNGDVSVELIDSAGVLLGTLTETAVLGVATFADLRPCEDGGSLRFSAAGVADLDSNPFSVLSGTGAVILGGDMSVLQMRRNEGTAALRRIHLVILDDAGEPWVGDVDGVKARLSRNGVFISESPADIVQDEDERYYVELAQPFTDVAEGSVITARVPADTGRRAASRDAQIIPNDSYAAAISQPALLRAIVRASLGFDGWVQRILAETSELELTEPGVGTETVSVQLNGTPVVQQIGE